MVSPAPDRTFVFNVVWTGTVFTYLRPFVASLIDRSDARFRFLGNGCPPEQLRLMERFASGRPDRVVEVLETSSRMVNHGAALDTTRESRDDGEFFCFVDPDILATGPFVGEFATALAGGCAAVTSGRGIWCEDDRVPPGHRGVAGEHFFAQDGFVFGSPHFAMYRRAELDAAIERWGVSFVSAGGDLRDATRARLRASGHDYILYDTGKLVNVFLQEDGGTLCHFEHPNLLHVGGMSHYLSPPEGGGGAEDPDWEPDPTWPWPVTRLEVARFCAAVLRDLVDGRSPPGIPPGTDESLAPRLERVRRELTDLVRAYPETGTG